jgi:tetratricopeptide (TPR) repeat protein
MFYAKGFVFIKLGKIEEAKNCFYEALELNPNYEEAKKGKKFISSLKKKKQFLISNSFNELKQSNLIKIAIIKI